MRTPRFLPALVACCLPVASQSLENSRVLAERTVPAGPDESLVEIIRDGLDADGRPVRATNSYVTLAAGLNRWEKQHKQWVPAVPEFEQTTNGHFVARQTRTQMILPPDLSTEPVDMLGPDGVRLISAPIGVAVVDLSTGDTALLGDLKHCRAELVTPHTVVYRDCFTGLKADLVYEVNLAGMEQFVVLREWIPALEDLAMDPGHVRVQVYTEFFDAPEPRGRAALLKRADPVARSRRVWEPDLLDTELEFGESTRMVPGRAFSAGNQNMGTPVAKSYESVGARRLLVESCDYVDVAPWLEQLPAPKKSVRYKGARLEPGQRVPSNLPVRELNGPRWASLPFENRLKEKAWASVSPETLKAMDTGSYLASSGPGMVLDYTTVSGALENYTFQGDTTYYVSDTVSLTGTTTLEGGAVVKYAPGSAKVFVYGPFECRTALYRPAIFTARDDDTVGTVHPDSTGVISASTYGLYPLYLDTGGAVDVQHVQIKHGYHGILFKGEFPHRLRHVQIVDCKRAVATADDLSLQVQNVLITTVKPGGAAFWYGGGAMIVGHNVTLAGVPNLRQNGTVMNLTLANSLLVDVTSIQSYSRREEKDNVETSGAGRVFQLIGAGHHYLAVGSPYRNAGTDQISADLLGDLQTTTTYPPVVYDDVTLSTPTEWSAQVDRDLDTPDLGYHYPPIDYAVDDLTVLQGGSLSVAPGIVIATFGDHGIVAGDNARVSLVGTASNRIKLVHFTTVQEQSAPWDANPSSPPLICGPLHNVISGHDSPDIELRFVDTSLMGGRGNAVAFLNNWAAARTLVARDCRFFGGHTCFASHYSQPAVFDVSNNLFRRSINKFYGWMELTACNNLFWGGASQFGCYVAHSGAWTIKDNAFQETSITGSSSYITRGHNAYLGTVSPTPAGWGRTGDVTLSSFDYVTGPLGDFYHAGTRLKNLGSRPAAGAGLYHHTTQADRLKEADTQVDIGFHYVGVDLSGENRALTGTASQINTYASATAGLAIDDNRDGVYPHGSVSHTRGWRQPWWQVDLAAAGPIAGVRLWNRTDCCMSRLSDFYVFVSQDPFRLDTLSQNLNQSGVEAFYFPGAAGTMETLMTYTQGRYLRVRLTGTTALNLAEVGVWSDTTGDIDGDGIPDYLEDANGNGVKDGDETDWRTSESNPAGALGLLIFAPAVL